MLEEALPGTEALETIRYWQPRRLGIFFAGGPVDAMIRFFDWKSNRVRDVCRASNKLSRGLAVSPDGFTLVYMREDPAPANIDFLEKIE